MHPRGDNTVGKGPQPYYQPYSKLFWVPGTGYGAGIHFKIYSQLPVSALPLFQISRKIIIISQPQNIWT